MDDTDYGKVGSILKDSYISKEKQDENIRKIRDANNRNIIFGLRKPQRKRRKLDAGIRNGKLLSITRQSVTLPESTHSRESEDTSR